MREEDGLTDRCRCHNQVNQKHGIKVASPFVLAKLFDSSTHFDQRTLKEAKVIATTNHRISHIADSIATYIIPTWYPGKPRG